jgi:rRNA maturation endonuclease Nob1
MTIIAILLIALLITGTAVFVLRPLVAHDSRWFGSDLNKEARAPAGELIARRNALYAALKDAEFDRETGKLTEEDYQAVRTRAMAEAAGVLRQLDHLTPEAEAAFDAEIEAEVARLREDATAQPVAPGVAAAVEAEIAALTKRSAAPARLKLACPDCGQPYQPGDAFCAACGASLADTCPQCGTFHRPGDAFCTRCGAALAVAAGE